MSRVATRSHLSRQLDLRDLNCVHANNFLDKRFQTRTPRCLPPPPPSTPRLSITEQLPDIDGPRSLPCVSEAEQCYSCLRRNEKLDLELKNSSRLTSNNHICPSYNHLGTRLNNSRTDDDAPSQTSILLGPRDIDSPQSTFRRSATRKHSNTITDELGEDTTYGWIERGFTHTLTVILCCGRRCKSRSLSTSQKKIEPDALTSSTLLSATISGRHT